MFRVQRKKRGVKNKMGKKIDHPCKGCSSEKECFESFDCEEYQQYIRDTEFIE